MNNWKTVSLGDVCAIKHGYAFKGEDFSDSPTRYILTTPGNFKIGGGFKCDKPKYYNGEIPTGYVLQKDDVIVTMTDLSKAGDTLGYSALVPNDSDIIYLHNQRVGLVDIISDGVDKMFLYWLLRTSNYQQYIVGSASGSTVKHTSPKSILNYTFLLPPIEEQRRIAGILGALDDKIECNNRINRNLEEQAAVLFRRWFVDFEFPDPDPTSPTYGKPYRSASGTMQDSPLGSIPQGWQVGTLLEIANYLNGLAMQKFRPQDGEQGIPVLKIKELGQGKCDSSSDLCSESIKEEYIINDGDVVFSWSGTLMTDIWCGGKCGLNQHLFKVTSSLYPKWFYFQWTKYHLDKFIRIAKDKAVTMGRHIKREDLQKSSVLIPDGVTLVRMNELMSPLLAEQIALSIENRTLTELRDTLLPKLMNNELSLDELPL